MAQNKKFVARWCGVILVMSLPLSGCGTVSSLFDRDTDKSGASQPTGPAYDESYDEDRPVLRV